VRAEVYRWVAGVVESERPSAPVLEVGARNVNGSVRPLFPPRGYLGLDMAAGPGVDKVMDILAAGNEFDNRFSTVVCCETLEHIKEPWRAVEIMARALKVGGLFVGSWCFAFPLHDAELDKGQSGDYWRTTPSGFEYLLRSVGLVSVIIKTEGCGRPANSPANEEDWQYPVGVFAHARRLK
jgi:SAM-dependent methyltransferase